METKQKVFIKVAQRLRDYQLCDYERMESDEEIAQEYQDNIRQYAEAPDGDPQCPYCWHGLKMYDDAGTSVGVFERNTSMMQVVEEDGSELLLSINYCPMCGRKVGDLK